LIEQDQEVKEEKQAEEEVSANSRKPMEVRRHTEPLRTGGITQAHVRDNASRHRCGFRFPTIGRCDKEQAATVNAAIQKTTENKGRCTSDSEGNWKTVSGKTTPFEAVPSVRNRQ